MQRSDWYSNSRAKYIRLIFILGVTTLLLVPVSWSPSSISFNDYIPSDDQGPEFLEQTDYFRDLLPNSETENIANTQLHMSIEVRDLDGIDTVIGSYKDINESTWTNVTLTLRSVFDDDWRGYSGDGENITLTPEMHLKIWNVRYYANDTLGNWNVSDVVMHSYNFIPRQEPQISPLILISIMIGIVGLCIVAFVTWRKRRT